VRLWLNTFTTLTEVIMKNVQLSKTVVLLGLWMAVVIIFRAHAAEFPVLHSASAKEIQDFLVAGSGSSNAKLVFVNSTNGINGQLCYCDFAEAVDTPSIHKITAVTNAKVPVISPDGQWVVYAAGEGGEAGSGKAQRSSVYICKIAENASPVLVKADSAYEPRFMQNASTGKDTIIYSTLLPDFAWQDNSCKTMKVGVTFGNGAPSIGTPQPLWNNGGYSGGQSWNKQYLCGGGGSVAMLDCAGNGVPDTITSYHQACNVSVSSSRRFCDRAMYLTTGDHDGRIKPDSTWRQWQVIFISDISQKVCRYYRVPTTFNVDPQTADTTIRKPSSAFCWHHPEWSNHPYFAAATLNVQRNYRAGSLWNGTSYQERLYLLNLRDSSYQEIVRPQPQVFVYDTARYGISAGFYWPWLWVQAPDGFDEDSLWLSVERPNAEVLMPREIRKHIAHIIITGSIISSKIPIVELTVRDLLGRKSGFLNGSLNPVNRVDLAKLLPKGKGVCLVTVTLIGGQNAMLKIMRH
jgi:hypothetical protein